MRICPAVGVALLATLSWASAKAETDEPRTDWLVPSLHSAGLLLGMRLTCSARWPETYNIRRYRRNGDTFVRSWSSAPTFDGDAAPFEWDHDPWTINLIGHGAMGSEIFLRHRQARHPWWLALGMTLAWTVVWEYAVEGWHKHPSGIDLLWSPVGGGLLGEGRYWVWRRVRRLPPSVGRHLLLYLVDPFGQLERDLFDLDY